MREAFVGQNGGALARIDAAPGDDTDGPAALGGGFGEGGGERERSRALDDQLIVESERSDDGLDTLLGDEPRRIDEGMEPREHLVRHVRHRHPVAERVAIHFDRMAGFQAFVKSGAAFRLDREDAQLGLLRFERGSDASEKPSAADWNKDSVHVGKVFEDLEAETAMAGHDIRIRPGMDERVRLGLPPVLFEKAKDFGDGDEHGLTAVSADRVDFGLGRGIRHQASRRDAEARRHPRQRLRGVARAHGAHTFGALGIGQHGHRVLDPSNLERADWLKSLELQVDVWRVEAFVRGHEGRVAHHARDASTGLLERFQRGKGDLAHGRRFYPMRPRVLLQ